MAEYIPSDEREEPTTKNALPSKTLIQILKRNQKLSIQAKVEENTAPPNQLYNKWWRNFFRQETQNKKKTYRKSSSQEVFQDVLTKTRTHLLDSQFLFLIPDFFFSFALLSTILTLLLLHLVNLAYYPFLLECNSPSVFICFFHQTNHCIKRLIN